MAKRKKSLVKRLRADAKRGGRKAEMADINKTFARVARKKK